MEDKALYNPPDHPVLIDVPALNFGMIDGTGDSNTLEYQTAVAALLAVSYPVVIALNRARSARLKVRPLEGLRGPRI